MYELNKEMKHIGDLSISGKLQDLANEITFSADNGSIVGRLYAEDGVWKFEGDWHKSAETFLKCVCQNLTPCNTQE